MPIEPEIEKFVELIPQKKGESNDDYELRKTRLYIETYNSFVKPYDNLIQEIRDFVRKGGRFFFLRALKVDLLEKSKHVRNLIRRKMKLDTNWNQSPPLEVDIEEVEFAGRKYYGTLHHFEFVISCGTTPKGGPDPDEVRFYDCKGEFYLSDSETKIDDRVNNKLIAFCADELEDKIEQWAWDNFSDLVEQEKDI